VENPTLMVNILALNPDCCCCCCCLGTVFSLVYYELAIKAFCFLFV